MDVMQRIRGGTLGLTTLLCLLWALEMCKDPGTKLRRSRQFAVLLPEFREACRRKKKSSNRDMSEWYRRGFHFGSWRLWESYQAWSDLSANRENTGRGRCLPVYKLQMVQTHHCQGTALLTGLLPRLLKPVFLFNLLKELPQIFVLVVNTHIRWIKSLKQEKPLTFWEMPRRCSADFCRHLSK